MKKFLSVLFLAVLLIVAGCGNETKNIEETSMNEQKPVVQDSSEIKTESSGTDLALILWQSKDGKDEDTMVLRFYPEKAPMHVKNFKDLANKKFYDGLIIFRVEPNFVMQTGSPDNTNTSGPGYTIDAEFNDIKHLKGTLAMARSQDPNSAGSQFYICLAAAPHLDNNYTVFGQVLKGMEVLDKVKKGDFMRKVTIVDAKSYFGDDYLAIIDSMDIHNK